jgi:hypothetical protein
MVVEALDESLPDAIVDAPSKYEANSCPLPHPLNLSAVYGTHWGIHSSDDGAQVAMTESHAAREVGDNSCVAFG